MDSIIKDNEQYKLMRTAPRMVNFGCLLAYKNRISSPTGKAPCTNLHCYKISHDNNYHSILGQAHRYNLLC